MAKIKSILILTLLTSYFLHSQNIRKRIYTDSKKSLFRYTKKNGIKSLPIPSMIETLALNNLDTVLTSVNDTMEYVQGFNKGYKRLLFIKKIYQQQNKFYETVSGKGYQNGNQFGLVNEEGLTLMDFGFEDIEIEGFLYLNFEQMDFRFLHCFDKGWVEAIVFDEKPKKNYNKVNRHVFRTNKKEVHLSVYVRAKALVSPLGNYGHGSAYKRELSVYNIIEIRESTQEEKNTRRKFKKEFYDLQELRKKNKIEYYEKRRQYLKERNGDSCFAKSN